MIHVYDQTKNSKSGIRPKNNVGDMIQTDLKIQTDSVGVKYTRRQGK